MAMCNSCVSSPVYDSAEKVWLLILRELVSGISFFHNRFNLPWNMNTFQSQNLKKILFNGFRTIYFQWYRHIPLITSSSKKTEDYSHLSGKKTCSLQSRYVLPWRIQYIIHWHAQVSSRSQDILQDLGKFQFQPRLKSPKKHKKPPSNIQTCEPFHYG